MPVQESFVGLTCVLLDRSGQTTFLSSPKDIWFPGSKVSAFLSHILADCTASSSKDPRGAEKSARKAL